METASKVESFLEAVQQSEPSRAALYGELQALYRNKLWHTVSGKSLCLAMAWPYVLAHGVPLSMYMAHDVEKNSKLQSR